MTVTDIRPDDTGDIPRPVGETTRAMPLYEGPAVPRRPESLEVTYVERTAFTYVGSSELPIIIDVADRQAANEQPQDYVGRHRAAEPQERRVPYWRTPAFSAAMRRVLRRNGGGR